MTVAAPSGVVTFLFTDIEGRPVGGSPECYSSLTPTRAGSVE
jgi:hypothetical protein